MNCSYMHNKLLLNTIFDLVGLILLFLDFWQFLVSEVGSKDAPTPTPSTLSLVSKPSAVSTELFELTYFSTTMEFMVRSLLDLSSAPFLHFELSDLIVHTYILFVEAFVC